MHDLQKLIDPNCPRIFSGNWKAEFERGWRWEFNLDAWDMDSRDIVRDYQNKNGILNVTVGHPFKEKKMAPEALPSMVGLYVRDVEDIMAKHVRDLDSLEDEVHKWANGGAAA